MNVGRRGGRLHRRVDREGATPTGVRTDDGVLLHTIRDGPRDAPICVVFAHGFAARHGEFVRQREALRGRAQLVLFDQRGHGRSGWGGRRAATASRLGRDLQAVLDATTGARPTVLVGHSMGGMAIMALAEQQPGLFGSQVRGVALLSTAAHSLRDDVLPRGLARLLPGTTVLRGLLAAVWAFAPLLDLAHPFQTRTGRAWLNHWLFGDPRPPPQAVTRMQQMYVETSAARASSFLPTLLIHDQRTALRTLSRVPTTVVTGSADATIPARHSHHLAAGLGPRARLVEAPGAGHMVNLTHPEIVNAALERLLDEVVDAPGAPGVEARR